MDPTKIGFQNLKHPREIGFQNLIGHLKVDFKI